MQSCSLLSCRTLKSVSQLVQPEDASSSLMGISILVVTCATHFKCTELPLGYPGEMY